MTKRKSKPFYVGQR